MVGRGLSKFVRKRAILLAMRTSNAPPVTEFTASERAYIRSELDMFFSTFPRVADGFQLRTWRGGPQKGEPKLPPTGKVLLERGLMRLDTTLHFPRLVFSDTGLAALRAMMADPRAANPTKFAHVRRELGIDPDIGTDAT